MSDPKDIKKEPTLDEKISSAAAASAKAAVDALMPAVAALVKGNQPMQSAGPAIKIKKPDCPICNQPNLACGYIEGEEPKEHHRKLAVYPSNPRLGRWFQPVCINGVKYLSNSHQHQIWVPKGPNFEYIIAEWENNENELSTGRIAEHNSGHLGPGGGNTSKAESGWR